jgi:hypothetical protein
MLVLFVAGLVIYIIAMTNLELDLVMLGMGIIFFCPFIIMALSSLTVVDWELDPAKKEQRSVEAKQARHLLKMQKARSNFYPLYIFFIVCLLVGLLIVAYLGMIDVCKIYLIIFSVLAAILVIMMVNMTSTVFSPDMNEHWVFIENGYIRQKKIPRIGHYRITPFRADQVKRAVWSTNPKGENMYVYFQMERPKEQVVYPIHQDNIKDEAAFKAFLHDKLEEKDVPSRIYIFPTDH